MDSELYKHILQDLNMCRAAHINDNLIKFLTPRYPNISKETLRSIVGLWHQRKITSASHKLKDMNIPEMYKRLSKSGNRLACFTIAERTEYSPALIAKIVLTEYLSELKKKAKVDPNKAKQLRKTECSYCVAQKTKKALLEECEVVLLVDESISVKRHNDPRIELALNLFDEDDDIGKYFLEKFKYSRDKSDKNTSFLNKGRNKSNKFYWQGSSFEQMGEKNVMQNKNIERLFSNPNTSGLRNKSENNETKSAPLGNPTPIGEKQPEINVRKNLDHNQIPTSSFKRPFKIKDLLNEFDNIELNTSSNEKLDADNSNEDYFETPPPSCEDRCVCNSNWSSEDSDTDDDDSEDALDNLNVRELMENTSLIEDPILAQDVFYCTVCDDQYGPTSDIISNALGGIYERILEDHVKQAGLPYKTENKLRGFGVDKTPDIILLVPVAVDGFVINWIESKALFADNKLHQSFKKNQFENYTNRFGPGCVIYWHGYVDDIPELYIAKKEIIIRDKFPSNESFTFIKSNKFKTWIKSSSKSA